jgi:hypothetical protein
MNVHWLKNNCDYESPSFSSLSSYQQLNAQWSSFRVSPFWSIVSPTLTNWSAIRTVRAMGPINNSRLSDVCSAARSGFRDASSTWRLTMADLSSTHLCLLLQPPVMLSGAQYEPANTVVSSDMLCAIQVLLIVFVNWSVTETIRRSEKISKNKRTLETFVMSLQWSPDQYHLIRDAREQKNIDRER